MSNDFRRINRSLDGKVEQKHLYVTYDSYCPCNCECCRNRSFTEESMQGKRYLLDDVLKENFNQFRHIIFGGGEPLYKIVKIINVISDIHFANIMEPAKGPGDDSNVTYFGIVTNGVRDLFLTEINYHCIICRRFQTIILSRYHYDDDVNTRIFHPRKGLELLTTKDLDGLCQSIKQDKLQLSCLCQKGGVNTLEDVLEYIKWAEKLGITNVMFSNFQDDVTPERARANLSCAPDLFERAMQELWQRGFDDEDPIIFSAGFQLTTFQGSINSSREMKVSFKEFIPENQLREEWKYARRRTYNYSVMPNGDLFSDWSCGEKI